MRSCNSQEAKIMRLERVGENQIKLFLSIEELTERGLTKEDVEKNSLKWHELYFDMVNEVYDEFDFSVVTTLLIDILTVTQREMVLLFTLYTDDELFVDDVDNNEYSIETEQAICYRFIDIEHVIQFARRVSSLYKGGTLYSYNNEYYLIIPKDKENTFQKVRTIISEYGFLSNLSIPFIMDYGTEIIKSFAVDIINKYFLTA